MMKVTRFHRKLMFEPMVRFGVLLIQFLIFATPAFSQTTSVLGAIDFASGGKTNKLPVALNEISGLTVTPLGEIFAHGDEFGIIFGLNSETGKFERAFALGEPTITGDFEGITWAENRVYLINSDGRIFEAPVGSDRERVIYNSYGTGIGKSCEVEGLAYDPGERDLLILCKTPRIKDFKRKIVIYRWNLDHKIIPLEPALIIDIGPISDTIERKNLHPTGLEVDVQDGHLIILAGKENLILEFSPEGELIAFQKLSKKRHHQPEGLTILPDGSLAIADEGGSKKGRLTLYAPIAASN